MMWNRLRSFFTFFDSRFEDLNRESWKTTVYRDFSAGLIVAMTAIPMAMGFAIAMGLRPEQGIIAGAISCMVGRTFGGSKYQVYGPTAAFIPLIAALMAKYGETGGGSFADGHGMLVLVSIAAGIALMLMGVFGLGKLARYVPNSIIVGFTVGIAVTIALSNIGEAFGMQLPLKGGLFGKLSAMLGQIDQINFWAVGLALFTFFATKHLLKISVFIPAPLLALGAASCFAGFFLVPGQVQLITDRFGAIPTDFFQLTLPRLPELSGGVMLDIAYFVAAIVFVSAVESVLCSSMADRMANNRKTPFDPDKELWGQGLVQVVTPLINGFPCTGALARTATSIKAGAVTPLAGYFKGVLKLTLAFFLASYLGGVPMACIAGILLWVASNMIKPAEIVEVWKSGRLHAGLMLYTAVMVPLTDFLTGVLSALVLYGCIVPFVSRPRDDDRDSDALEWSPRHAPVFPREQQQEVA
ncbi:MAG: SulP family inorganic anion transporter [Pirellulales bacterium]|nr:SulP family inorganic anion transporter [Pirellulales bacterium]